MENYTEEIGLDESMGWYLYRQSLFLSSDGQYPNNLEQLEAVYNKVVAKFCPKDINRFNKEDLPQIISGLRVLPDAYSKTTYSTTAEYEQFDIFFRLLLDVFDDWAQAKYLGSTANWEDHAEVLRFIIIEYQKGMAFWDLYKKVADISLGDSCLHESYYITAFEKLKQEYPELLGASFREKACEMLIISENRLKELYKNEIYSDINTGEQGTPGMLLMHSVGFRKWLSEPSKKKNRKPIIISDAIIRRIYDVFNNELWADMTYPDFYNCFDANNPPDLWPDFTAREGNTKFIYLLLNLNKNNGIEIDNKIAEQNFGIKNYHQLKSRVKNRQEATFMNKVKAILNINTQKTTT